ncbi:hypothetical protein [Microbacterium sp. CH-015]|uniref:hypothetical protein n=1 Tax=Microbacterium sp. CH-015 TaxID=3406734 RepID=UPI003C76AB18
MTAPTSKTRPATAGYTTLWGTTDQIAREDAPLPILDVRVGPPQGESERQRKVGVESLLRANGLDIAVNGSDIAYLP